MKFKAIMPHVLWTISLLLRALPYSQTFDLANLAEKLPLPNLKSLLGSSEAVQKLLQSKGILMSGEAPPTSPMDLNRLLAQLKPKQGRLDPAVLDMLSAFDTNYSGQIPSIFGNSHESNNPPTASATVSRRIPTSTEEDGILWSSTPPTTSPGIKKRQQGQPPPRKTVPNLKKFSSKFRNKTKNGGGSESNQTLTTASPTTYVNSIPFDHITDPNIRNHRLYDWEFETYKNFTHIDQAEDLMADESEHSEVVAVRATPASVEAPKFTSTTIIPSGWIPKRGISRPRGPKRPTGSMEESQLESSGDLLSSVIPGTYVKFPPTDSEEPKPPREPLRESSTENLVFAHASGEDRTRDRYSSNRNRYRDKSEENKSDDNNRFDKFRPSQSELSPPVFIDPDQDFFTSTIRNPIDKGNSEEYQNGVPGFRPPGRKRNRKRYKDQQDSKGGRRDRHDGDKKYFSEEEDDPFKRSERNQLERDRDQLRIRNSKATDPGDRDSKDRASEEHIRDRDRYHSVNGPNSDDNGRNDNDRVPSSNYRPANSQERIPFNQKKSDRILSQYPEGDTRMPQRGDSFGPDPMMAHPQGADSNPYFQPGYGGVASNELGNNNAEHNYHYHEQSPNQNGYNPSYPNSDYNNNNNNNNLNNNNNNALKTQASPYFSLGYDQKQYQHPFAEESHSVNQFHGEEEGSAWSNTYFILGGLIALSALSAFLIPTLLSSMGRRQGKHRHDLTDEDLNGEYQDENTSTSTSSTSTVKPESSDPTADTDLWTEIKGVYNDVVNIVRGDYGGIVDKLTGNSKDDVNKDHDGPNIVYRDDMDDEDEKYENVDITRLQTIHRNKNKNKLRNRKGNNNSKKNTRNSNVGSGLEDGGDSDDDYVENKKNSGSGGSKKKSKNRTINSTINYMVRGDINGYPAETSRAAPVLRTSSMAGFHLPNSTSMVMTSTESFMGEWAKVQLIGN